MKEPDSLHVSLAVLLRLWVVPLKGALQEQSSVSTKFHHF